MTIESWSEYRYAVSLLYWFASFLFLVYFVTKTSNISWSDNKDLLGRGTGPLLGICLLLFVGAVSCSLCFSCMALVIYSASFVQSDPILFWYENLFRYISC